MSEAMIEQYAAYYLQQLQGRYPSEDIKASIVEAYDHPYFRQFWKDHDDRIIREMYRMVLSDVTVCAEVEPPEKWL
jgi:hypothetical protein